jgi:type VI secretion system secreted protein VgrG
MASDKPSSSASSQPAATGGAGRIPVFGTASMMASSSMIGVYTMGTVVFSAGNSASLTAQQDINQMSQGSTSAVARAGLNFFTYGKAQAPQKPNQETGIALHAASGSVHVESNDGKIVLYADEMVEISSHGDTLVVSMNSSILLTAAGAGIEMDGTNVQLKAPGKIEFKAAMKEFTGPASASADVALREPSALEICGTALQAAAVTGAATIPLTKP